MTDILQTARTIVIVMICGFGVAGTSRSMHNEPVSPYYAQLASKAVQALDHTKQSILRGHNYVGAASK